METVDTCHPVFNFIQCIEELILNSIDGHASCIAVRVNWDTFSIQVLDNGTGISTEVLKTIGLGPIVSNNEEGDRKYGSCGRTLHLVNQLSGLLSIESQKKNSNVTWKRTFKEQKIAVDESIHPRKCCGTTVTIEDYLYNTAGNRSGLEIQLQMKKIKGLINSLTLLHSEISFSVRDDSTGIQSYSLYQVKKYRGTMEAAEHLFKAKGFNANGKLFPFRRTTQHFKIKGLVGNQYLKSHRFVYVNNRCIESVEIDNLLSSIFQTNNNGKSSGIILNIKCAQSEFRLLIKWDRTDVQFQHWNELLRLMKSSLAAIHTYITALDSKTDQIDKWLDKSQSLKTKINKAGQAPSIYTAIKQHDGTLPSDKLKVSEENRTNSEDTCKENCRVDETLETTSNDHQLSSQVVESMECDLEYGTVPFYGRIEQIMPINQSVYVTVDNNSVDCRGSVIISLKELHREWTDEKNVPETNNVVAASDEENNEENFSVPETINVDVITASNGTKLDTNSAENSPVPETISVVPASNAIKLENSCEDSADYVQMKPPRTAENPVSLPDNWIELSDAHGSYFCNTLSGNTSYEIPAIHRKQFEFRSRIRVQKQPSINFKALQVPNEFWVNHKQPLNVSKTSSNSFPQYLPLLRHCKFSRNIFETLVVVKQVDLKFISCIAEENGRKFLILLDQHAAHERVCLEKLIEMHSRKNEKGFIHIESSPLQPHLQLTLTLNETDIVQKLKEKLIHFGLSVIVSSETSISVTRVPSCFLERETSEIKRGRNSVYLKLSITLLRDIIAEYSENGRVGTCLLPVSIRNVLNSLACHGAIKFGDRLTHNQCTQLVRALAQCDVPFQCAHGRPSVTPLLELGELVKLYNDSEPKPRYGRLMSINR